MRIVQAVPIIASLALLAGAAIAQDDRPPQTVQGVYPGLVAGVLASASIGDLQAGALLDMGDGQVTQQQVNAILAGSPENLREQLTKNSLFLVQEMATKTLLPRAAREWARTRDADAADKAEPGIISEYLQHIASDVTVSDAEIGRFYDENRAMFGESELADIRETLRQFVLKTKRQERVDEHVRGLAGRYGVVISGPWLAQQAIAVRDNPVDKARESGRPTLVDFGADGCQPCEMMAPILQELKEKYTGRANIVFVHVRESPVLAARHGIRSIPVQVFFDKDGEETFRHTGFFAQEKIEEKLAEMGVR